MLCMGEGMSCKLKAQKDKQEKGGKAKKFFGQKDDESSK